MSLFTLKDLRRLDPSGVGSLADRHRKLFPGNARASAYDRELVYLVSKGATAGTIGDRWRKVLSVPAGTRVAQAIRGLPSLP